MNRELLQKVMELEGLAKMLFDKAVGFRYWALFIEIGAGLLATFIAIIQPSENVIFFMAFVGFALLAVSYTFKICFAQTYENAETMRRQAVLANGLGWDIERVQFSEWRRLAGKNALKKIEDVRLDENYYATQQDPSPLRLLEMTQESAFWTRHLYVNIKFYLWIIFLVAVTLFLVVLTLTSTSVFASNISLQIAYVVYLLMPLILTLDVLGWAIKLTSLSSSIKKIEEDLERLKISENLNETSVLRLVFEYNCQLIQGFPIPNWFFNQQHDYIASLWERNNS